MMKRDIETTIEALAMLEDDPRIGGLEALVRKLNKELWVKNRTSVTKVEEE